MTMPEMESGALEREQQALAALDVNALVRDVATAVAMPSITGNERPVVEAIAAMAERLDLEPEVHADRVEDLRTRPGFPGGIAERDELVGMTARIAAPQATLRMCLNGHIDVVDPGTIPWTFDPWSAGADGNWVRGRGSVDMKGGAIAALHAMGALRRAGADPDVEVVLQAVPSEEDGGSGTFAALERDDRFDACLIPEPTALSVVCAHAGAQQFAGTISGRSAHAAMRLEGRSALDRYVQLHLALATYEDALNNGVEHPLMRKLALPYPVAVGKIQAGVWASQVPDRLAFEGRFGIRIGEDRESARAAFESLVRETLDDGDSPAGLRWTGGFGSGATDPDQPFARLVREAASAELGREVEVRGEPYGADMWQFCARGIPCVMFGPHGIELAHAVDERVPVEDLIVVAQTIIRTLVRAPSRLATAE